MNLLTAPGSIGPLGPGTPSQLVFGGCTRILAIPNWFTSTKAFKFVCNLAGFMGDIGPWDWTDPDGDGSPGTNPGNLNALLTSQGLGQTRYWQQYFHAAVAINIQATVGDVGFQISTLGSNILKNTDNGKYYALCSRLAMNGSSPDGWQIDTLETFGTGPSLKSQVIDGTIDLQPHTQGDGAAGTIALVATDWW